MFNSLILLFKYCFSSISMLSLAPTAIGSY